MKSDRVGRIVVTERREDGTSFIRSDSLATATPLAGPAVTSYFLWDHHETPQFASPGADTAAGPFPPPGGCSVSYLRLAPGSDEAYYTFIQNALGEHADRERPGFHETPTRDLVFVLSGRLRMDLDEGSTELGPGDLVVQNGTPHRWSNIGDDEVLLASIMLGARRTPQVASGDRDHNR